MTKDQVVKLLKASLQPQAASGYNAFTAYIENQGPDSGHMVEIEYSLHIERVSNLYQPCATDASRQHLVTVEARRNKGIVFSGTSVEALSL